MPYYCDNDEPILRHPITTGAASGTSYAGAIYRGICEIIERDAFMINYLNMLPRAKIVNLPKRIQDIIDIFTRYLFVVYIIELTTDIPVPVFAAIILDYSGVGPAVSIGLKADLDTESAILGALEEAEHSIPFMRGLLSKQKTVMHPERIDSFEKRAIFWSDVSMIQKLDFWLENGQSKIFDKSKSFQALTLFKFKRALKLLDSKVSDIIFVDITPKDIRKKGFLAVKVIIPELQPLYLYEGFSYHGGERLYQVPVRLGFQKTAINENELNSVPPLQTGKFKKTPQIWKEINFKTYPRFSRISLNKTTNKQSDLEKIISRRYSERNFAGKPVNKEILSRLLLYSGGILHMGQNWHETRRAYPSTGARYPLEIYIILPHTEDIQAGVYHYNVKQHSLEEIIKGDHRKEVTKMIKQEWVKKSSIIFIITAVFKRTSIKYTNRTPRHIFLEAGHLAQNIYLLATNFNLGCCAIGGFDDDGINKLLDLNSDSESVVYILAVGRI